MASLESTRNKFMSTFIANQNWSIPSTIIHYINKSPTSAKVYKKMAESYSFSKLILVNSKNETTCPITLITSKIWITEKLKITYSSAEFVNYLIPKIYTCQIKKLHLNGIGEMQLSTLLLLSKNVQKMTLVNTIITSEDPQLIIQFEALLEAIPTIKSLKIYGNRAKFFLQASISTNTITQLLKIPSFHFFEYIQLFDLPESFDIVTLFQHIKQNKTTKFKLEFAYPNNDNFPARIEHIYDEIIETALPTYKIPYITCNGIDGKKRAFVHHLYRTQ